MSIDTEPVVIDHQHVTGEAKEFRCIYQKAWPAIFI